MYDTFPSPLSNNTYRPPGNNGSLATTVQSCKAPDQVVSLPGELGINFAAPSTVLLQESRVWRNPSFALRRLDRADPLYNLGQDYSPQRGSFASVLSTEANVRTQELSAVQRLGFGAARYGNQQ
jgi:hypothetical protein